MATSRFQLPGDGLLAAQVCLAQRMPRGNPAQLRSAADRSGCRAADLRRVAATLLSCTETTVWNGEAHRAFVAHIRTSAPSVTATAERYEHYASALSAYAGVLDETAPLLVTTRGRLQQRYDELAGQARAGSLEYPPSTTYPARPEAWDLLPLAETFKVGYDRWADALDRCIWALSHAGEADRTRSRHGFGALTRRITRSVGTVLSPFERAVLHPSLANISTCLGSLNLGLTTLGLGLLFICPAVGAACLTAATVLAVAQLAVDAARRERGEQVGAGNLGMDLAAAIPVGGGAVRGLRTTAKVTHLVPGGGLMAHEGLDGGHTLAKHVGKSEEFLRNRLATEPKLDTASTFFSREVAENALCQVLDSKTGEIQSWLASGGKGFVLTGRGTQPLGIAVVRGTASPVQAAGLRLILKRSGAMSMGFRIHTAMVEL